MKPHIFMSACVVLLAVLYTTPALASDTSIKGLPSEYLTCHSYGGDFVLNETDFKALTQPGAVPKSHPKITPAYVVSLKLTSAERKQICDSRALWRAIDSGRCDPKDFKEHYPKWLPQFFASKESEKLLDCQIDIATR